MSRFCRLVELCVRQPEFVICWGSQGGEWQHWTIKLDAVQCCAGLNNIMGIWGVGLGGRLRRLCDSDWRIQRVLQLHRPLYSDWTYTGASQTSCAFPVLL